MRLSLLPLLEPLDYTKMKRKRTDSERLDQLHAREQLKLTMVNVYGFSRNGLKQNFAIEYFAKVNNLTITGRRLEWIVELYRSQTNPYIRKTGEVKKQKIVVLKPIKERVYPEITESQKKHYNVFIRGAYWKLVRNIILKRDEKTCQKCGSKEKLQVHHKTYKNHLREHENLQDLVTLCENCHKKEHGIVPNYKRITKN